MTERETLSQYYPRNDYMVMVMRHKKKIAEALKDKSVAGWGRGPIGKTGYHLLLSFSPQHKGDKSYVFVCKSETAQTVMEML